VAAVLGHRLLETVDHRVGLRCNVGELPMCRIGVMRVACQARRMSCVPSFHAPMRPCAR
jgi:hypothetical protein